MVKNSNLLTAREAEGIDIKAREVFGISTLVLMENAGRSIAEEALRMLRNKRTVAIFCGRGNNGGDGFVAARHLLTNGIKPDVFLAGNVSSVHKEAKTNLEILLKLKQKVIELKENNLYLVKNKVSKYALIIDALLGVGLRGEVKGIYRELIKIINASLGYILSVDIPSGLDATTGRILGNCIRADKTVTFVAKKRGMILKEGRKCCGTTVVEGLGIPLLDRRAALSKRIF